LVSGFSHWRFKNIDKGVFLKLLIPGVVGGVLGAWFLSSVGDALEPFIDLYLIVMGAIILSKAFRKAPPKERSIGGGIYPLGLAGGFLDATGGGGWGPVVTSTMIASGHDVKKTIGSVNAAEFIVTIAETTTFLALASDFIRYWQIILGLVAGGICAAPLAAYVCKKLPVKPLLAIVGILIIGLNIYNLAVWLVARF
ncbi:MAG: sulfite exporter TauE/SafE family protein, partial [Clostridia bacterium]|nr:sulfite exporter TauE/SafE family protein [Clostridia bacterium]